MGRTRLSVTVTNVPPLTLFFKPRKLAEPNTPTFYMGKESWNGDMYECVEQRIGLTVMRFYVGPDWIVHRVKVHAEQSGQKQDVDAALTNVRTNGTLEAADFSTAAPKGAVIFDLPVAGSKALEVGA